MRNAVLTIFATLMFATLSAKANDNVLETVKFYIIDTTQMRLAAFEENDLHLVCNATEGSRIHSVDTISYYLSFEFLSNEAYADILREDIGDFALMRYQALREADLPNQLHNACMAKNSRKIKDVMESISFEMSLE